MELKQIYAELLETAGKLGIKIRKESGSFRSGYCRINDEEVLLLNKSQPVETISSIVAKTIITRETGGVYLKPAVREYIEKERNGNKPQPEVNIQIEF